MIAAIVILVILAGLSAFVVSITVTQNVTFAQDVQGARAYQAARAGIEWQISTWLSSVPSTSCSGTTLAFTDANLSAFTTSVTALQTTSGGIKFCAITSTATTGGSTGALGYIERQLHAVVEGN